MPYNRTLCCVLDEMRECVKTLNFSYLLSLIEEVQTYANRMEAKLSDVNDYESIKKRFKKIKEEMNEDE